MSLYLGDEDERYVLRLADYIEKREGLETVVFTKAEEFAGVLYSQIQNRFGGEDIFILGRGFYEKLMNMGIGPSPAGERIYCLTAEHNRDGERAGDITFLYKYKSAADIVGEIFHRERMAAGRARQFDPGMSFAGSPAGQIPVGQNFAYQSSAGRSFAGQSPVRQGTAPGTAGPLRVIPVSRKNSMLVTDQKEERGLTDEIARLTKQVRQELEILPEINDETVIKLIDEIIGRTAPDQRLSAEDRQRLKIEVFNSIRRFDVLQSLMDDESVTEIMVNGMHNIFIEKDGRLYDSKRAFSSKERLEDIIQQIAAGANRTVNTASPILDARLPDGARVSVVLEPVAVNGPILTIRRFPKNPISDAQLVETGSATMEVLDFMRLLVEAKYNIIISGGTGSGKTTFLNILSGYIPHTERIITIEDSAELQLRGIENLVSLETRNANTDGVKPISIRDLIKASLRMRPDRIVVGEVRGEEAIDMLQAMNVGMDGSLSTIHANSAKDALSRLTAMMLMNTDIPLTAVRTQICSGVDIIVQLGRLRDKSRRLLEVIEVTGYKDDEIQTRPLFVFREEGEQDGRVTGEIIKENELLNRDKLLRAGLCL